MNRTQFIKTIGAGLASIGIVSTAQGWVNNNEYPLKVIHLKDGHNVQLACDVAAKYNGKVDIIMGFGNYNINGLLNINNNTCTLSPPNSITEICYNSINMEPYMIRVHRKPYLDYEYNIELTKYRSITINH